jgi:hypothetical protein
MRDQRTEARSYLPWRCAFAFVTATPIAQPHLSTSAVEVTRLPSNTADSEKADWRPSPEQRVGTDEVRQLEEILKRVWGNLIARASGPLNFRLIIQPIVAGFLAIRAGLKDARDGRPVFLWTAVTNKAHRPELFHQGRKDVEKVFALAVLLDAIYQLMVQRGVYVLELLIVAPTLAVIPYVLLRGPVSRIARWVALRRSPGSPVRRNL